MDSDTTRSVRPTASQEFARLFGLSRPDLTVEQRAEASAWVAEGDDMHAAWVAADPTRRAA